MLERVLHQFLRRHVNYVIMARDDVVHLRIHALLNELRRILAVEPVELAVDEGLEVLDGVFNLRRKEVVRNRANSLAPVGDHVCVLDDDLVGLFCAQVREFFQHLVGRFEVDGKRLVRVGHLLGSKKNVPVNFVLGVEKVHVAGCDHGLSELVAQLYNRAVEAPELFFVLCYALLQHEAVVADGLNLEIVIKFRDALELGPALVIDNGLKELARLAGRADDESLAPS